MTEHPDRDPLDKEDRLGHHRRLDVGGCVVVQRLDRDPGVTKRKGIPRDRVGPRDFGKAMAGFLGQTADKGDSGVVDDGVRDEGRDDLPAQPVG